MAETGPETVKASIAADQHAEIRALLVKHINATDIREKDRVQRETVRAESEAQFRGAMKEAMTTLQGKQADHEARFTALETETEGKFRVFGQKVLVSIEEGDKAVIARVEGHNQVIVDMLKGQNDVAEAKAKAESEAAQAKESMRARHKVEGIKAKTPIWLAVIGLLGLVVSNLANCQATQAAQIKSSRDVATLTAKVDAIPQTVAAQQPPAGTIRYDAPSVIVAAPASSSVSVPAKK